MRLDCVAAELSAWEWGFQLSLLCGTVWSESDYLRREGWVVEVSYLPRLVEHWQLLVPNGWPQGDRSLSRDRYSTVFTA